MKEHAFNNFNESVTAPHFDDERTLLSARQVVPLDKINARVRHRRQWFLGGAFALAMMLGAGSALLAAYLRGAQVNNTPSVVAQVEPTPEPVVTEEASSPETVSVAAIQGPEPEPLIEEPPIEVATPRKENTTKRKPAQPEPDFVPSQDTSGISEEEQLENIRNSVLYEEWQERRLRRVRRERRRAERDSRDLSNLDEIFEGRRRRLNP